jgi:hypothetical protein
VCGTGTSVAAATLSNPLVQWQYSSVEGVPFRVADVWRGYIPNVGSYLGCLVAANASYGMIERFCGRNDIEISKTGEVAIGTASGALSALGATPGEYLTTKDNQSGLGFRKIVVATVKKRGLSVTLERFGGNSCSGCGVFGCYFECRSHV